MNKKIAKRISSVMIVLVAMVMVFSMNTTTASAKTKTVKAKSITLSKKSVKFKKGKKVTLKATIKPKNSTQKKIVWSSSKKSVATVTSKGVVTAKGNGTATIKATVKGTKIKATCKVKVTTPVSKVKLSGKSTLEVGKSTTLKAKVTPSSASNKKVVYSSSDTTVATVSSKGVVKGVKEGSVTITATAVDGSGKKATKVITVKKPVVQATDIKLDADTQDVFIGKTIKLTATIEPANTTDTSITWSSSNEAVATVDMGNVTAVSAGTAVITATTSNNLTAQCTVTVQDTVYASNLDELTELMSELNQGNVVLKTDDKTDITIPGSISNTNVGLVIDAPNANIINNAKFRSVSIENNSDGTYTEKTTGNIIIVFAEKASVIIDENASATVNVTDTAKDVSIKENGTLSSLNVSGSATVNISGTSEGTTNIDTTVTGDGSKIITTKPLNVKPDSKITLILRAGAEDTVITVETEDKIPEMQGTESVKVHVNSTGEDVMKETDKLDEQYLEKMTFTGKIENSATKDAVSGKAYLAAYTDGMNIEEADLSENVLTFDVTDGTYSVENVMEGSYVLMIKADGYKDFIQMIVISTRYGEVFKNEDAQIVPVTSDDSISCINGNILNSANKEPVEGITVQLVKHKNNKISSAIAETTTDYEGYYSFDNIASGNYTIRVVDNRITAAKKFISTLFNVCVNNGDTVNKGTAITEEIDPDEVRFVLTWGSEGEGVASDLDAWLFGPTGKGNEVFKVFFNSKYYRYNGITKTMLDVDHTLYNGPETTTIIEKEDGIYDYYVHRFSYDGQIGTSQVRVDVYMGSNLVDSFVPPTDCEEEYWYVCRYDSVKNEIIPVNKPAKETIYNDDSEYKISNSNETDIEKIECTDDNSEDYFNDDGYFNMGERKYLSLESYIKAGNGFRITLKDGQIITDYKIYYPGDDEYRKYAESDDYGSCSGIIYFENNGNKYVVRVDFEGIEIYGIDATCEDDENFYSNYYDNVLYIESSYASLRKFIEAGNKFTVEYSDETKSSDFKISYKGEELFNSYASDDYDAIIWFDENAVYTKVKFKCELDYVYVRAMGKSPERELNTSVTRYDEDYNEVCSYKNGYMDVEDTYATLDEAFAANNYTIEIGDDDDYECDYEYAGKTSEVYNEAVLATEVNDADGFLHISIEKYGVDLYVALYHKQIEPDII